MKDFRRKKRKGGKLDVKWLGPYAITSLLGKGFYSLKHEGNGNNHFKYHYRCFCTIIVHSDVIVKRVNGGHLKIYKSPIPSPQQSDSDSSNTSSGNDCKQFK